MITLSNSNSNSRDKLCIHSTCSQLCYCLSQVLKTKFLTYSVMAKHNLVRNRILLFHQCSDLHFLLKSIIFIHSTPILILLMQLFSTVNIIWTHLLQNLIHCPSVLSLNTFLTELLLFLEWINFPRYKVLKKLCFKVLKKLYCYNSYYQ